MMVIEALIVLLKIGKSKQTNDDYPNKVADIIQKCDGVDKLKELQSHTKPKISQRATWTVQEYFDADDDEPECLDE